MRASRLLLPALALALWAQGAPRAGGTEAVPERLPDGVRLALKKKMGRHAQDMTHLVTAVTRLSREDAAALATRIAEEPRLSRPVAGGEEDVNALLPERFFQLQNEVHVIATQLAEAAAAGDDVALGRAFGRLAESCVSCHAWTLPEER